MKKFLIGSLVSISAMAGPAIAAPTVHTDLASFNAATTGVTTLNFEGTPTGSSVWLLPPASGGSYSEGGLTITQSTNNAFRSDPAATNYYYNWGTGDVINTPYGGTLTITFASAVTAFGLDLGSFFGLPFVPGVTPGEATTGYGADIRVGTSQGNFIVDPASTRNFTFFGLTSDTAFTSFTLTGATSQLGASMVFDNVRFGSTVAAVPEPATWAMFLLGFGFVGFSMRRRQGPNTNVSYSA